MILVLIGGFFLWSNSASAPAVDEGASSNAMGDESLGQSVDGLDAMDGTGAAPEAGVMVDGNFVSMTASVSYDGIAFSPASVTIARGGTVNFTDSTGATMWVASNVHPSHTNYDSTSRADHCATGYTGAKPFDQCAKGSSFSFTFDKAGTFEYHDHANSSATGVVIVE
ncbi:hypothetical protein A2765_06405 [Candidatus Kaiserbacteria bacterium RIFCSPHIGHO2_01_FULL_56_24]|uniref:Blue (type 1) copper domain-containing protein n=1 Tax=Candidatus Kaiserbacteria bacterium RIFCSPHIGHO2_01_FULL_56_24 TaxID=1798487 RepID=A0A1F6DGH7_9BACT|nr:MAG: hypothetical protein A2765_06405 [Candidatus Kaiserbacteria bacterium RIFCSPHIGHO2_01_FULL_56_24]